MQTAKRREILCMAHFFEGEILWQVTAYMNNRTTFKNLVIFKGVSKSKRYFVSQSQCFVLFWTISFDNYFIVFLSSLRQLTKMCFVLLHYLLPWTGSQRIPEFIYNFFWMSYIIVQKAEGDFQLSLSSPGGKLPYTGCFTKKVYSRLQSKIAENFAFQFFSIKKNPEDPIIWLNNVEKIKW